MGLSVYQTMLNKRQKVKVRYQTKKLFILIKGSMSQIFYLGHSFHVIGFIEKGILKKGFLFFDVEV